MEDSGRVAAVARAFNVVGFAGSLRRGSCNRALLRAATELAPSALRIVIHELDGIPLYNGDIEAVGEKKEHAWKTKRAADSNALRRGSTHTRSAT